MFDIKQFLNKYQKGGFIVKDYSNPNSRQYFSSEYTNKNSYDDLEKYLDLPEIDESPLENDITKYITSSKPKLDYSGYTLLSGSDNKNREDISDSLKNLITLFNKYNARIRVTSGYRKNARTSNGSKSHHSTGMAIDIVPEDGNFDRLRNLIKHTKEISDYMKSNGLGVLEEITPETMAKTGATGKHFHIGPDYIAQMFWMN